MANVLVTGGAGFIGSHLVDRLLTNDHTVHVWDDFSTGREDNLQVNDNLTLCRYVDIEDLECMRSAAKNQVFDVVFHLAAQINLRSSIENPIDDAQTNILGTLNLLKVFEEHSSPNSKFVFTSTGGAIYDPNESLLWSEFSKASPQSPYGLAKLTAESYIRMACKNHLICRLSNVYGPRQNPHGEAGVVAIFLERLLRDKPIKIFGDGMQTRDFVYVDDVVDALMLGMNDYVKGTYNVSTGDRIDVNQISQLLIGLTKKKIVEIEYLPEIKGELKHSGLSYHSLCAKYGWRPKTIFYDGLQKTVEYYADI